MQFWTRSVQQESDIRLRVSYAGGILMLVCLLAAKMIDKNGRPSDPVWIGVWVGMVVALIGWALRGFKLARPFVTETEIVVSAEEIRVGDRRYRVDEVEYLDFLVNSYNGMLGPRLRWRRMVLHGTDNKLFFTVDGKKHSYGFYLEDEIAMRRLGMLFREFYSERVRFRERNRAGRTFLFEQVLDRKAFERARRDAGYE